MVRRLRCLLIFLAIAVGIYLAHPLWLPWIVRPLFRDDGPAKADAAVVLGGDWDGYRIVKGAELVRDGYVPYVVVSGTDIYSVHECDLAIDLAVKDGFPRAWFIALPDSAHSTEEEAVVVLAELRRRNVQRFILVTSDYHTGRAARIYRDLERKSGYAPEFRVVSAADKTFQFQTWWRKRQGRKTVFMEWLKIVSEALGLA